MDDDNETVYATGPGKHPHSRGPVITAYVDTDALDYPCPKPKGGCGVLVGDFCIHPNGALRKIPCPVRMPHHAEQLNEGE